MQNQNRQKPITGMMVRKTCDLHGLQVVRMSYQLIEMSCGCKMQLDQRTRSWKTTPLESTNDCS